MRKSLRLLAVTIMVSFIAVSAFGQSVTINGTVTNASSKENVPAVSVIVKGTSLGTYTDDKGNFSISVPSKFPLTLVFSSVGFTDKEVYVESAASRIEVEFTPTSTLGQEVVVAAARTPQRIMESPVTIERLSSSALKNAAVPNYYEALANLKGVDMHTASLLFRTVTTRGFVSSGNVRFTQLIDGMDNQAPGLNFSVGNIVGLTELDVDNIELLSGASSALYGSGGMNGTLLINSKNPFKYQGLSFNVKQGIMHIDGKQRSPSPYYDWTMRFAKNINNKFAFKLAGQLVNAQDWQADDYRNVQRTSVVSKVVGGDRTTDPNYDGINVYGDESSANMFLVTQLIQENYRAGIQAATGGQIPNVVALLNQIIPANATQAQINSILGATFAGPLAGLLPTVSQMFPFYWGLRQGWVPNQAVSRTGYNERDLVDYNAMNVKFTGGLHYKITDKIEASWNTYWGTGTNVYTGTDRYSLRNFQVAQHRLEVKHKNWFVRGYTTQENAGEAYAMTILGQLMNEAYSPSPTSWFPTYIGNFIGFKQNNYNAGNVPLDANAHAFARAAADVNRPLPGTSAFENLKKQVRSRPIAKGAKFLDKSDLWSSEAQLNLSDIAGFSDKVEVITGVQWKQWVLNSQGTIFADTAGAIKINETGGYMQLRKKFFDDILTLNAAIRYDKQSNFDGRWTPRFTAVVKVAKDHNVRASFQTAYRFPTNQDQYINLNTGTTILIGSAPDIIKGWNINGPGGEIYSAASVAAARQSLNTSLLQQVILQPLNPESVASGEFGYKGLIGGKLLIDAYTYYSRYKNFFSRIAVVQSRTGSPSGVLNPSTSRNFGLLQNSSTVVKAYGWGVSMEYELPRGFYLSGNIFSDKLRDLEPGVFSFFNAPEYRWNLSLRNDNVYKNIGFNVIVKFQDNNYYEGTFVTGTLPYFTWVDAQVTYRQPKTKSTFRIGGTNIGNHYARTGFGSPFVGGVYYLSYGYNIN